MRKRLIITAGILSAALAACGSKPVPAPAETPGFSSAASIADSVLEASESPDPENAGTEGSREKANYRILEDFADALSAGDYAAMKEIVYLPENSILTEDDLEYSLLRSDYVDLMESAEIRIEDFDGSAGSSHAVLRAGQDEVSVSAALKDDNKWYIELPEIYSEDVTILAPAKAQVTLNGVELDTGAARKHSAAQGRVVYTVTIPKRPITAVVNTIFGDLEKEMVRRDDDPEAMYSICPAPDDVLMEEIMTAVKTDIEALYALYEAGSMEVTSWQPYFSEKTTPEKIEAVQAAIKNVYTWNDDVEHLAASQVLARDNNVWIAAYDSVGVNVKLENKWDDNRRSHTFAFFVMTKKEDGSWVFGDQYPIDVNFTDGMTNYMVADW